jgi:hypothetical protein
MKTDENGVVARLPGVPGHEGVRLRVRTPAEKALLSSVEAAGLAYEVRFVRVRDYPKLDELRRKLRERGLSEEQVNARLGSGYRAGGTIPLAAGYGSSDSGREWIEQIRNREAEIGREMLEQAAKLRRGERVEFRVVGAFAAFRPVKAVRACLSCHPSVKQGEALGAIRYLVQQSAK